MAKAKKTQTPKTSKKKEPSLQEIIKEEVDRQLQEALLNIEIEPSEPVQQLDVDLDTLKKQLYTDIKKEIKSQVRQKNNLPEASISRSELNLYGQQDYRIVSGIDGLEITESETPLITISKNGPVGFGLKAPRSVGKGSAHFRANYPSEAPIPSSGKGCTRGLIVEGDGDDENVFTLRVLSVGNRQGLNVTGAGKLILGDIEDKLGSKISVTHNDYDSPGVNIYAKSKFYADTLLDISTESSADERFNFLNFSSNKEHKLDKGIDLFRVDGEGSVFTETGLQTNESGYAELFEWADGNHKNEDRTGFTVALNEKGKLVNADEGDSIIGVVQHTAAIIGNYSWNDWKGKYTVREGKKVKKGFKVVEWTDQVGVLHSHYQDSLDSNFVLPDNAVIYETDAHGNEMYLKPIRPDYDEKEYKPRLERGWAVVILKGTTNLFKGQHVNKNWVKIKDSNDDQEQWLLL